MHFYTNIHSPLSLSSSITYQCAKIACEGMVAPDCSSHPVAPCHQLPAYSAKGCANVSSLIVFTGCVCVVYVSCLALYSWSLLSFTGGRVEYVKVLPLKAADTVAVTEEALDSSQAPARPPAFTLTLIQSEKTTHSSNTNSVT